jgi:hypothetical protein
MDAMTYLKDDTAAYYCAANDQVLIGKLVDSAERFGTDITLDDLNERGLALYNTIQNNEWKASVKLISINVERSGVWTENTTHPLHYNLKERGIFNGLKGSLCTWNNLSAIVENGDKRQTTSLIVLYTDKWLYTISGSLYKIT